MSSELCTPSFGAPLPLDGEERQTDVPHPMAERAETRKSDDVAIRVENLSKCYQIYDKPRDRLMQMLTLGRRRFYREFWALRNISFDVKKGETVGIIGRNGSGKSTLLQMICGTLNPTSGSIQTNGRIAALLELGSGFNPEFTGRENVYLNATVLGLSSEEIDASFDEIAAFADIGEFIDQPVKTYSSGMYVRLAFAVAVNVKPDMLIVDEALAVGDEPFQRKCYSRIERIRDAGVTILLVTHAANTITQMCSRALLLDHGSRLYMGDPKLAVESYYRLIYSTSTEAENIRRELQLKDAAAEGSVGDVLAVSAKQLAEEDSLTKGSFVRVSSLAGADVRERYDPGLKPLSTMHYEPLGAKILDIRIENSNGQKVNILAPHEVYWFCYEVRFWCAAENVHFGMLIKTTTGNDLGAIGSHPFGKNIVTVPANAVYVVRFPFFNVFSPGTYFMNAGCSASVNGNDAFLHRIIDAIAFRVELTNSDLRYAGQVQISAGDPTFKFVAE